MGRPVNYSQWEKGGIQFLGDIFGLDGLRSFQDIKNCFNLVGTSSFFNLQLRAALKSHGVPWQHPLPIHPLHELIVTKRAMRGMVSTPYLYLLEATYKTLPVDRIWRGNVPRLDQDFDCDMVWANIKLASRNPDQSIIISYTGSCIL